MKALEINGLRYSYPDGQQALHGVDLEIRAGERVALLGPNGAGKTTLVLHLNGILPQPRVPGASGTVAIGGQRIDPADRAGLAEIRRRVGIVFQDPDDQLFLPTVAEDVAFGPANLGLRGPDLTTRVNEALSAVGMLDHRDRAPHHLSLGQRRRVAVATVLAMRPQLLVLDEPSSNLDPQARRELADILLNLTGHDDPHRPAYVPSGSPPSSSPPPGSLLSGSPPPGSLLSGSPQLDSLPSGSPAPGSLPSGFLPPTFESPGSPSSGSLPAGSGPPRPPVTMLMVTHDLPYALQLCDRAVILDQGRIAADAPTTDLLSDPALLARHRLELPYGFSAVPT